MPAVTIDGVRYLPEGATAPTVGVAISSHNRPDVFAQCIRQVRANTPDAVIVIVDDASTIPVPDATFRFDTNVGIAACKNKAIELLMAAGVEHIILLDDDCWGVKPGWTDLYVNHPEPHLLYLFKDPDRQCKPLPSPPTLYDDGRTYAYSMPRGCLIYLHRTVIDRVGGFRTCWGPWGHEHVEYSLRIHAAGLTTNAFQDVCGSKNWVYSIDEHWVDHPEFKRSVDPATRKAALARNDQLLEQYRGSSDYVEYRDLPNLCLTTLLTKVPDPQRGTKMVPDPALVGKWMASLQDCEAVVLVDELQSSDPVFHTVPTCLNPYLQRWVSVYQYLRDHPVKWVWITDGTDVTMLQAPWPHMTADTLYVGYESTVVGCQWLRNYHKPYGQWIDGNADRQLLNAGVVGGDYQTVLAFTHDMVTEIFARGTDNIHGDMAALQYVCYSDRWINKLVWGSRWVTEFKANKPTEWSIWQHK